MADLGFVRNESARAAARRPAAARSPTSMLDAGNPFFTDVAQGIELAAEAAELSLFICNSDDRRRARGRPTSTCSSSNGCRAS